jgi:hypothetical protein
MTDIFGFQSPEGLCGFATVGGQMQDFTIREPFTADFGERQTDSCAFFSELAANFDRWVLFNTTNNGDIAISDKADSPRAFGVRDYHYEIETTSDPLT